MTAILSLFWVTTSFFVSCTNDDNTIDTAPVEELNSYKVSPIEAGNAALDFVTAVRIGSSTRGDNINREVPQIKSVTPLCKDEITTRSINCDNDDIDIDTLFYIVNFEEENGYVLVAADKRTEPIYAIVDSGNYVMGELASERNEGFLTFLERAAEHEIWDISDNAGGGGSSSSSGTWTVISKKEPLLKTRWSQKEPYSSFCPNKIAGCVVTATAQILSYYQTIGSVSWNYNGSGTSAILNWSRIIYDCESNNGKLSSYVHPASSYEVATLIRYLGNAMGADYDTNATHIGESKGIDWMNNWGGLKASKLKDFNETNIINAIKENKLVYGRGNRKKVKVLGITVGYKNGHAWIYDGYITGKKNGKTYNLVHCNWGWGGDNNGYYLCEVFNTGTGAEFPDSGCDETQDYYYKYNLEYSIVSR